MGTDRLYTLRDDVERELNKQISSLKKCVLDKENSLTLERGCRVKLIEALEKIKKGEGRYMRDPLEHAGNCIEDMKAIANAAIDEAMGGWGMSWSDKWNALPIEVRTIGAMIECKSDYERDTAERVCVWNQETGITGCHNVIHIISGDPFCQHCGGKVEVKDE